jgi:hypothetical protein
VKLFHGKYPYKIVFDFSRRNGTKEIENDWETFSVKTYSEMVQRFLSDHKSDWFRDRNFFYIKDLQMAFLLRIIFAQRIKQIFRAADVNHHDMFEA